MKPDPLIGLNLTLVAEILDGGQQNLTPDSYRFLLEEIQDLCGDRLAAEEEQDWP